jgi:D-serine deaminase-like pyridoxal phosphate-dependent protein
MTQITRQEFLHAAGIGAVTAATVSLPGATARAAEVSLPTPLQDLPTPALLIDGPAFERNIKKMAEHLAAHGVKLRPHAKTHKSADIARKQLGAGAIGICCAKVSEAETLAREGIGPLLVTSPLTTADKAARFVALAKTQPEALVVVDSELGAEVLAQAAREAGITAGVLIDLDVGTRRTGVTCGEPAVAFAKHVAARPELKLHGVQAYAGHLMHVDGYDIRRQRSLEALGTAAGTRKAIEAAGIPCPIFSGGGTGTFDIDIEVPGITDLQCGSYLFMDVQYRLIGGPGSELLDTFEPTLFVWSTAISQPAEGRITVDAGYKALSNENVRPMLLDHPNTKYSWGGDEHGILSLGEGDPPIRLGDKVKIFIAHCDPTVNLYDHYHVVRDGQVVEQWPVTARGCSQ